MQPGETIAFKQDVAMLEAIKMHIPVQASIGGIAKCVKVKAGDVVNNGDVLLEVE